MTKPAAAVPTGDTIVLGTVGIRGIASIVERMTAAELRSFAHRVEELGFSTLWVGESTGREIFTESAILLAATERLVVATSVANLWARDPTAMVAAQRSLVEAYPGRFVLGIGVSHAPLVSPRGHDYQRPLEATQRYLDAMAATEAGPRVGISRAQPVLLAALGPKMLELARDRTAGAHPYLVPVVHTASARSVLGPDPLLAPEVPAAVGAPAEALTRARTHFDVYLGLPNYVRNLERHGLTPAGDDGRASRETVEAVVAVGGPEAVLARVQEHLQAGADHVALQLLPDAGGTYPMEALAGMAADLLAIQPRRPAAGDFELAPLT